MRINGQSVINEGDLYYIKKIKYINSQVALIEARLQNERYLILTTHEIINNKGIRRKCYYTFDLINIYPDYKLNDTISITNLADIYSLQIKIIYVLFIIRIILKNRGMILQHII